MIKRGRNRKPAHARVHAARIHTGPMYYSKTPQITRAVIRGAWQCGTFTGMVPVYGVLLILFEWYWYMVCESGIQT